MKNFYLIHATNGEKTIWFSTQANDLDTAVDSFDILYEDYTILDITESLGEN